MKYVSVIVGINSERNYYYFVPDDLENNIFIGSVVTVDFRGNEKIAIIKEFINENQIDVNTAYKPIKSLHFQEPVSNKFNQFIAWIAYYYHSTPGNVIRLMIPSLTKSRKKYVYRGMNDEPMSKNDIKKQYSINEKRFRELLGESIFEDIHKNKQPQSEQITLNDEQHKAYIEIEKQIDKNEHKAFLLYGPPASGKTEVYLEAVKYLLRMTEKSVIILFPEIGLAQFMYERITSQLGSELCALYHSELSDGERYFYISAFLSEKKRVLVGTRSAMFVPVKNPGLIIVDEEQDMSYKQTESAPFYNARDAAVYNGYINNIPVVLASATPSLETYANAEKDKYNLLTLSKSYQQGMTPNVKIIQQRDVREQLPVQILDAITDNLRNKKQTMVFLNRRGYLNLYRCVNCNEYYSCEQCSVSMSFHKDDNKFKCHYCGREEEHDATCRKCGSRIESVGIWGTQKIEMLLKRIFPGAKVMRMDIDTSGKKNARKGIINSMRDGKTDILIGTQMISKGYDLPEVKTMVILNADSVLHLPDFRSEERFMQLLIQTAGRAGRRDEKGDVIISGSFEGNICEYIKDLDYMMFLRKEIKQRKFMKFPPHTKMAKIIIKRKTKEKALNDANSIFTILNENNENKTIKIYSPVSAIVERVGGVYRFNIFIIYNSMKTLNKLLKHLSTKRLGFVIDIDSY